MSRTSTIDKKTKSDFCIEEILGRLIINIWTQLSKFQKLKYFYLNTLAAEVVWVSQDVVVLNSQTLETSHQPHHVPCRQLFGFSIVLTKIICEIYGFSPSNAPKSTSSIDIYIL